MWGGGDGRRRSRTARPQGKGGGEPGPHARWAPQELQQRNAQLLATVRKLTADSEATEQSDAASIKAAAETDAHHRFEEAKRELAELQAWRQHHAAQYVRRRVGSARGRVTSDAGPAPMRM